MTQNTVPLPEPATVTVLNEVAYYTTDQMHAHAAKVCAEKDAEITKWIRRSDKTWHEKHFTDQIAERDAEIERLRADAARYRWLRDNCSYSYGMQPDSPAEHGIEYHWQQGSYEERDHGINKTIDAAIEAAIKEAK